MSSAKSGQRKVNYVPDLMINLLYACDEGIDCDMAANSVDDARPFPPYNLDSYINRKRADDKKNEGVKARFNINDDAKILIRNIHTRFLAGIKAAFTRSPPLINENNELRTDYAEFDDFDAADLNWRVVSAVYGTPKFKLPAERNMEYIDEMFRDDAVSLMVGKATQAISRDTVIGSRVNAKFMNWLLHVAHDFSYTTRFERAHKKMGALLNSRKLLGILLRDNWDIELLDNMRGEIPPRVRPPRSKTTISSAPADEDVEIAHLEAHSQEDDQTSADQSPTDASESIVV